MTQSTSSTGGNSSPFSTNTAPPVYQPSTTSNTAPSSSTDSGGVSWEAIGIIASIIIGGVTTYFVTMMTVNDKIADNKQEVALVVQSIDRNNRDFEKIENEIDTTQDKQEAINREFILLKYRVDKLEKTSK